MTLHDIFIFNLGSALDEEDAATDEPGERAGMVRIFPKPSQVLGLGEVRLRALPVARLRAGSARGDC